MIPLIIANWKMNLTFEESIIFCSKIASSSYTSSLVLCPPIPYLAYLASKFRSIQFCAQNISALTGYGAYTGEYSSVMIKECSINYALVGHSERRNIFHESNETIKQKAINCNRAGVTPIICIGEPKENRRNGSYKEFLLRQLEECVPVDQNFSKLIIGYEPLWSIGTGLLPSEDELIEIFELINSSLKQSHIANNISLVYGGSVNLDNLKKILNLKNISGVLVGKASLDSEILLKMLQVI
jgi:triosephosphate isomerase